MFKERLREVVEGTEGAMAGLLMGFDGIPVDQYAKGDASLDVEIVGMEFSVILKEIKRAAGLLEAGPAQEVAIRAEKLTTVIRMLNDQYFAAVALQPNGNFGKARYLLRLKAPELAAELE